MRNDVMISLIVAVSRNGVIGVGGQLPWHLPDDLRRFRELTIGKPVVMGRRTFQSIGSALPGRQNIVITRQKNFDAEGCQVVGSPEAAISACGDAAHIMVIGGGEIYTAFLPLADRVYKTWVNVTIVGDAGFPELCERDWRLRYSEPHAADEKHQYDFEIRIYERLTAQNR